MNLRGQYYPGKGVHSTHWTFDWGAPINGLNALKNRKKPPFLSHTGHSLATISTELSWLPLCLFIYLILLRIIQINLLTNQWTKQPTNQPTMKPSLSGGSVITIFPISYGTYRFITMLRREPTTGPYPEPKGLLL